MKSPEGDFLTVASWSWIRQLGEIERVDFGIFDLRGDPNWPGPPSPPEPVTQYCVEFRGQLVGAKAPRLSWTCPMDPTDGSWRDERHAAYALRATYVKTLPPSEYENVASRILTLAAISVPLDAYLKFLQAVFDSGRQRGSSERAFDIRKALGISPLGGL